MKKILLASVVSAAFAFPAVAAEHADVVVVGSGGQVFPQPLLLMTWARKSSS